MAVSTGSYNASCEVCVTFECAHHRPKDLARTHNIEYMKCSAKEGCGVEDAFMTILRAIVEHLKHRGFAPDTESRVKLKRQDANAAAGGCC